MLKFGMFAVFSSLFLQLIACTAPFQAASESQEDTGDIGVTDTPREAGGDSGKASVPSSALTPQGAQTCHQGTLRDDAICLIEYADGSKEQLSTWWCPVDEAAGPYGTGNVGNTPQESGTCRHWMNDGSSDSIWCCAGVR